MSTRHFHAHYQTKWATLAASLPDKLMLSNCPKRETSVSGLQGAGDLVYFGKDQQYINYTGNRGTREHKDECQVPP